MSSSAIDAAAERPLLLRARRDLVTEPIDFRGARYWSIKDPLSLKYYQLCDEELFILKLLDGGNSLEEIRTRFESRFAPRKLDSNQLHAFLGTLHREGLATASAEGQAEPLLERRRQAQRRQLVQSLTNILAIRFQGIDPEPLLQWLYPKLRWIFSRPVVIASWLFMLAAILLVTVNSQTFVTNLPRFQAFFSFENLILMALVLAGCKVIHEFGHALTCKRFGGECHELGIMFLVFTPCLYCNVSDAWMIRSKWRRIAISAAGIYVELLLAAACTFLWWFSQPGLLNAICLNVMFVCSVSTLLFNGNPLLRYDGYFVLADFVEMPNLRQQSQTLFQQTARRWCFGIESSDSWIVSKRHRAAIMGYGLASLAYRWLLVGGILFVAYKTLEPHRLQILAQLLGVFVISTMVFVPVWQMVHGSRDPRIARRGSWGRRLLLCFVVAGLLWAVGLLPVSKDIAAPVVIEPAGADWIHTTVPGRLIQRARIGQHVTQGETLAELVNSELDRKVVQLTGQRDVQRLHVEQLKRRRVRDQSGDLAGAGSRFVIALESLAASERELARALEDQAQRRIIAPSTGTVLAPRSRPAAEDSISLPTWSGCPLDGRNAGCFLERGTTLCIIGNPDQLQAILVVEQGDIERIRPGQSVRILLDELHQEVIHAKVQEVSELELDAAPPELAAKRLIATESAGNLAPLGVYYAVSVTLPQCSRPPPLWSSGRAKIEAEPRTLGKIVYEALCRTFRIDL
jgi:putative peptide zinc metalloprotease protein